MCAKNSPGSSGCFAEAGKRFFDFVCSFAGLCVLSPVFLIAAALIKSDSPGTIFFLQERVGKNFRKFRVFKLRTMVASAERQGPSVTGSGDARITRIGKYLRKYKIDELPQLLNVLKGDMSLVGPRPEVPIYVEKYRTDYEEILKVKPGITDSASLAFRNENELLKGAENPEKFYVERILPAKIQHYRNYVENHTFLPDIFLILKTIAKILQ